MLKVYDKAQWHIDAGEDESIVIKKMNALFDFLDKNGLLNAEGKEILEIGIDDSVSVHERMLSEVGNKFMKSKYDLVIDTNADEFFETLEKSFEEFKN